MARMSAFLSLASSVLASGDFLARRASNDTMNVSSAWMNMSGPGMASFSEMGSGSTQRTMIRWSHNNVNNKNLCLSVAGNEFRNGQNIQQWECVGSRGQYFRVDSSHEQGAFAAIVLDADPRYCVVVDGNQEEEGANIQLWNCNSAAVQKWTWTGSQLQHAQFSGMCLAASRRFSMVINGDNVQLSRCNCKNVACIGYRPYLRYWALDISASETSTSTPQPSHVQFFNVGNGKCVAGMTSVDSAVQCIGAAEALWPKAGCYGAK